MNYNAQYNLDEFITNHMVMKDSKGKSESPNYDSDEVTYLWNRHWELMRLAHQERALNLMHEIGFYHLLFAGLIGSAIGFIIGIAI